MRSEKRPLVLKIATLPFNYTTRKTAIEGVSVEPNGNDFNFRVVDLQPDSDDFVHLTNHILSNRLARCDERFRDVALEDFLGVEEGDDLVDYFNLEMAKGKNGRIPTDEEVLEAIVASLSEKRQARFERIKNDPQRVQSDYFKRFAPVHYVRQMKDLDSRGNRTVGWFAGAKTFRRVADGNPRRFIQLMHDCFELAKERELTPMNQHRIVTEFTDRQSANPEGLPDLGPWLQEVLIAIGDLLGQRVHEGVMVDGGCAFSVAGDLLQQELFRKAIELGIQYSFIFAENPEDLSSGIREDSLLRLAYLLAVHYWIPMRRGDPVVLRMRHTERLFTTMLQPGLLATRKMAEATVKQMEFELVPCGEDIE